MSDVALAFVGLPNCGKTTATGVAAREWGDTSISVGSEVRDRAAAALGDDPPGEKIGDWLWAQYRRYGSEIFSHWMIAQLERETPTGRVVVDGVRAPATYRVLESYFDHVALVHVTCPFERRLRRMWERGRAGEDDRGREYLRRRDARDRAYGVERLTRGGNVTHRIENTGSREALDDRVRAITATVSRNVTPPGELAL